MDMMSLRRAALSGAPGGLYRAVELVARVSLDSDATSMAIPFSGPGFYFIVPDTPITSIDAIASGYAYVFSAGCFLYAVTSDRLVANNSSTFNNAGLLGYWPCGVAFSDSSKQSVVFSAHSGGSVTILASRDYLVIKQKLT